MRYEKHGGYDMAYSKLEMKVRRLERELDQETRDGTELCNGWKFSMHRARALYDRLTVARNALELEQERKVGE